MLLKQARMVHWKKWAAEHECEELKEGAWLNPVQAMLRRKTNGAWTDNHRVVEGEWVQKRLYDIGWSDEKKCKGIKKKARRSTDYITVRRGRRPETRSQTTLENDGKWPRHQRKIGIAKRNRVATSEAS